VAGATAEAMQALGERGKQLEDLAEKSKEMNEVIFVSHLATFQFSDQADGMLYYCLCVVQAASTFNKRAEQLLKQQQGKTWLG